MAIYLLGALALAFLASFLSGRRLVPWLKKNKFWQPLKDEVAEQIYTDKPDDPDADK